MNGVPLIGNTGYRTREMVTKLHGYGKDVNIQMARELVINSKNFGKIANEKQDSRYVAFAETRKSPK
jgi:hypothetical protein